VGDDLERAERALDAEIDGSNRASLVSKLEDMLDREDPEVVAEEAEPEPE
jgi:hypothetical protein